MDWLILMIELKYVSQERLRACVLILICDIFLNVYFSDLQEISYVVHFNDPDVYSKERKAGGDKKGKGKS